MNIINIIKSLFVLLLLLVLVFFSVFFMVKMIKARKNQSLSWRHILSLVCAICVTITCFALFGEYTYPFERSLTPKLFCEFDVPEQFALDYPGQEFWHGAYEKYGLYGPSIWFDTSSPASLMESKYGFGWPPMDFERHSYIITYGQKIESLSYNVWDTIDAPFRTGAKVGHMILDKEFSPEKVYIYEIPKLRIDNDISNPNNPWD